MIYTYDEISWPDDVKNYLGSRSGILSDWHLGKLSYKQSFTKAKEYDRTAYELSDILRKYHVHGYHCSRLTAYEIGKIKSEGMYLPNEQLLNSRIQKLINDGQISQVVGSMLIEKHQAAERNGAGMLWFCFFEPYKGEESGIERFFRFWGGEALYNSHENDPDTAEALRSIGMPCIIEAKVPINGLNIDTLSLRLVEQFSFNRRWRKDDPGYFESYTRLALKADEIMNIHQYPEPYFLELSKCQTWRNPLS